MAADKTSKPNRAVVFWVASVLDCLLAADKSRMSPPPEAASRRAPAHSHFRGLRADRVRAVARGARSLLSGPVVVDFPVLNPVVVVAPLVPAADRLFPAHPVRVVSVRVPPAHSKADFRDKEHRAPVDFPAAAMTI